MLHTGFVRRIVSSLVVLLLVMIVRSVIECNNNKDYDDVKTSFVFVKAYFEVCSSGYGYCPKGNTCCHYNITTNANNNNYHNFNIRKNYTNINHIHNMNNKNSSNTDNSITKTITIGTTCIPNDLGSYHGTCCYDDGSIDESLLIESKSNNNTTPSHRIHSTGCGLGYTCTKSSNYLNNYYYCQASKLIPDPLVQILPRYQLCDTTDINQVSMMYMYGWPIVRSTNNNNNNNKYAILPYYSSHGKLTMSSKTSTSHNDNNSKNKNQDFDEIERAIIVIHGAGRNADDYFCSIKAAINNYYHQQKMKINTVQKAAATTTTDNNNNYNNILIIAPRFTVTTDIDANTTVMDDGDIIQWDGTDIGGPWRYGANAVSPLYATNISSYNVMDMIVSTLLQKSFLPNLRHISVIGHSSGGQFVQRWSFLTSFWDIHRMKGIVANPSSYLYLTDKRRVVVVNNNPSTPHQALYSWSVPSIFDCPDYDRWQFGLQPDSTIIDDDYQEKAIYSLPYVNESIHKYGIEYLIQRYALRHVIYMIGNLDQCNVSGEDRTGWCYSHGLETSCPNMLQGTNRYERHWNYYLSLQQIVYGTTDPKQNKTRFNHHRVTIEGVGHDHSLMFNSYNGLKVIFDPILSYTSTETIERRN